MSFSIAISIALGAAIVSTAIGVGKVLQRLGHDSYTRNYLAEERIKQYIFIKDNYQGDPRTQMSELKKWEEAIRKEIVHAENNAAISNENVEILYRAVKR